MARIDELFSYLKDNDGSDLHLASGVVPKIRRQGSLEPIPNRGVQTTEDLQSMLQEIASRRDWETFETEHDLDFAYGLEGVGRFRANYLGRQGGVGAVFRIIPTRILTLKELGAPEAICNLAHVPRGLVLVTGPTGSGKSTTLAAIINEINETYCRHIITIEDPVEFVHPNKKSVLCQREVGLDTQSFAAALQAAIRQDAQVIVLGEMRDIETISLAITAAEMGALVFGTLHTNNAIKAIDRLIDAFPADMQDMAKLSLAEALTGVVAQLLLPTLDGKRAAVHEILLRNNSMPNIIRQGNMKLLRSVIQSGKSEGMCSMDDSILKLLKDEKIDAEAAYHKAQDKQRFASMLSPEELDRLAL